MWDMWVGVIPGKGNRAPHGRETAEHGVPAILLCSGRPAPARELWAVQSHACTCVRTRVCTCACGSDRGELSWAKAASAGNVEDGLDRGQKRTKGQLVEGQATKEV